MPNPIDPDNLPPAGTLLEMRENKAGPQILYIPGYEMFWRRDMLSIMFTGNSRLNSNTNKLKLECVVTLQRGNGAVESIKDFVEIGQLML